MLKLIDLRRDRRTQHVCAEEGLSGI